MRNFDLFVLFFIAFLINNFYFSFVNAWTSDQFFDYCEQITQNSEASSTLKNQANYILNNATWLENYISSYNNFVVRYSIYNNSVSMYCYNGTLSNATLNTNKTVLSWGSRVWTEVWKAGNYGGSRNENKSDIDLSQYFGLVEIPENVENNLPTTAWLQNKYKQGMEFTPYNRAIVNVNDYQDVNAINLNYTNEFSYLGYISKLNENSNYYMFRFIDPNGNVIGSLWWNIDEINEFQLDNMKFDPQTKNIYIKNRLLYKNNVYTLGVYSSDEGVRLDQADESLVYTYVFINANATISNGVITDPGSGDNYTTQDSTNDTIGFIQNLYDDLFKPSSGDLEEVKTVAYSFIPSGDTPLTVLDTIFGSLNNDPDDFIIRWDNIALNFSLNDGSNNFSGDFIAANYINFSKLCRENSTFGQVKFWINILSVIGFLSAYIWTYYKGVLMILGVSTEFVNTEPEHREIGFIQGGRQ